MEDASPASVQQADGHTCLARAAVIVDLDPGIDVSLPLHALQVIGIHTEAWGQLTRIDDPVALLAEGVPHGQVVPLTRSLVH